MSVIGANYHSPWASNFILLLWNGGPEYTIFDTHEIAGNVKVGQHYYPEIFQSEMGYATKIAREQARPIDFNIKLFYPWTVEKLNKIVAYTAQRYRLDIFVNNFCDMSVGSSVLQRQVLEMEAVLEYSPDIVFQEVGGAKGIQKDIEIPIRAYESRPIRFPRSEDDQGGGDPGDPNETPGPGGPGDIGNTRQQSERGLVIWSGAHGGQSGYGRRKGIDTVEAFLGSGIAKRGIDVWVGGLSGAYDQCGEFLPELIIESGGTSGVLKMQNGWIRLTEDQLEDGELFLNGGARVKTSDLILQSGGGNPEKTGLAGVILDCNYSV